MNIQYFCLKVLTSCRVTDIKVSEDVMGVKRVQAVETENGTIKTPLVINCAGKLSTVSIVNNFLLKPINSVPHGTKELKVLSKYILDVFTGGL